LRGRKDHPQISQICADERINDCEHRTTGTPYFPRDLLSLRYYPSKSLQGTKVFYHENTKERKREDLSDRDCFFVFSSFRAFVTKSFAVGEGLGGLPGRKTALWIVLSSFAGKWPRCVICGSLIC